MSRIGNGASTHFWTDLWTDCGVLRKHALDPSMVDTDMLVQDFWINSEWDMVLLFACLPMDIVERILCVPISMNTHDDCLIWRHTPNGRFSVKSA